MGVDELQFNAFLTLPTIEIERYEVDRLSCSMSMLKGQNL